MTKSHSKQATAALVHFLETMHNEFYGLNSTASANDFLFSHKELRRVAPDLYEKANVTEHRGIVLVEVCEQDPNEMFLAISISDKILTELEQSDPRVSLSHSNLDAFWVLVEEVSHFHLIRQRAEQERTVRKLELEFQGEIDKLIFSGALLHQQCDDPHFLHLARANFEHSTIIAQDVDLYWDATRSAARYWYELMTQFGSIREPLGHVPFRNELRALYHSDWAEKMQRIDGRRHIPAAA